jgi:hypothetical protein
LTLINPGAQPVELSGTEGEPLVVTTGVYEHNDPEVYYRKQLPVNKLDSLEKISLKTYILAPQRPGEYRLSFSIEVPGIHLGKNCRFYHVTVE